jgi:integrase
MKGVLQKKPPLPKYQFSWDLDLVLKYLETLPINRKLTLSVLGKKLAILLALAVPKRASEIARLDRRFMSKKKNSVKFDLRGLSKTQKNCKHRSVKYFKFSKKKLCVVSCLNKYETRTQQMRPAEKSDPDPLLRSTRKPFKGLSPQTVGNWIKWILKKAGIDIAKFQAHSCHMVSTCKAANGGVNIDDILSMADWSNTRTFEKFYFRTAEKMDFADKVLTMVSWL